jgi:hypothetical protein
MYHGRSGQNDANVMLLTRACLRKIGGCSEILGDTTCMYIYIDIDIDTDICMYMYIYIYKYIYNMNQPKK